MTASRPDTDPRCLKCEGHAVRRHHRKCPKRGACHKGRGLFARNLEGFWATMMGGKLRVRRGRHGQGLSTTQAELTIKSRLAFPPATLTATALQRRVAARLGLSLDQVQVASPSPGEVAVQVNARTLASRLAALEEELRADLPGSALVHVESVPTPNH